MYEKRERQRLKELFSGLEPLDFTPDVKTFELQGEPEDPASAIVELDKPFLDYASIAVELEAEATANPQIQEPDSINLVVAATDQIADADPDAELVSQPNSALSLSAISNVITSPLSQEKRASGRPLTEAELSVLTWQAMGIGILIGGLVTGIVLSLTAHLDIFGIWGRCALAGGEVLFAILGALFNISSRKSRRALWIGAIGWSLIPVFAAILFILLLSMVMLTNFFGV